MKQFLILLILSFFVSCVSKKKYDELESKYYSLLQKQSNLSDDYSNLEQELNKEKTNLNYAIDSLNIEIGNLESKLKNANDNLDELQSEFDALAQKSSKDLAESAKNNQKVLAELKGARLLITEKENELRNKENELADKIARVQELESLLQEQRNQVAEIKNSIKRALKNFDGKGITVKEKNGRIYVSMDNKLLFASGKWVVQKEGITVLNDLAKVLTEKPELIILIEGHTDNVEFNGGQQVKDNWDLSVMRATAITKILQKNGVLPTQMTAGGRSEYIPIESNKDAEGRAKNRRVEIILVPNLNKINQLLNSI